MLVLSTSDGGYPDDTDPSVRYRLPSSIAAVSGADGHPAVAVSRSRDGGLLHLRLGAVWPTLAANERRAPFADGRFRLLLQTPLSKEAGDWHPTPVVGNTVVERSISLTAAEAAIAAHLGQQTDALVDVDVELRMQGLSPAFPWLASAPRTTLQPRLAALLHAQPATWDAVEAAFLGLTRDTFTWHPLSRGALPPPLDDALRAIAHQAAPLLMTSSAAGWTLTADGDDGPDRIDVSLAVPGVRSASIGFRWSFSDFLAAQTDQKSILVDLGAPGPFAASVISVVNDLPLSAAGIRSIAIDVRTGGPSGLLHHEFVPGAPSAARLSYVVETFDPSAVQWRARYTVMTGSGPLTDGIDFRPAGQIIEIDSRALSLAALRIAASPEVFVELASLEVTIGTRVIVLTPASPDAWAVGRRPPADASVTAVLGSGERRALGVFPLGPLGLTLDAVALGMGERVTVTLCAPVDLAGRSVYLAVQTDGGPWRTLEPADRVAVPARRGGRWQPARVKYRTRHVPAAADGTTQTMTESAWRDATAEHADAGQIIIEF